MKGEVLKFPPSGYRLTPKRGNAGLAAHIPGAMVSVSNLANASDGIKPGNIIERDTK